MDNTTCWYSVEGICEDGCPTKVDVEAESAKDAAAKARRLGMVRIIDVAEM